MGTHDGGTPGTAAARQWFAEDLRVSAPVLKSDAVIQAFATVPREAFLRNGPWEIHSRLKVGATHPSATAEPHEIYHDVLVTIDAARGLNSGLPSLWAMVFDQLDIQPGQTVLQVGAGVGYFSAILAELVGPRGQVIAFEIDADLATRAAANLAGYAQVEVISGDATATATPRFDIGVVFAGVTHVPEEWLSQMSDGGRMALPFTGADGWGAMMLIRRQGQGLPIRSLTPCGFYPCAGARRATEERQLTEAFKRNGGGVPKGARYHPDIPNAGMAAWVTTDRYWISA